MSGPDVDAGSRVCSSGVRAVEGQADKKPTDVVMEKTKEGDCWRSGVDHMTSKWALFTYICVYAYIYACIHICTHMHICIHICTYMHAYMYALAIYEYMYTQMYIYAYV